MSTDPGPVVARSPFLDLPGAVAAEGPDAGVPAHLGSLVAEQRALAAGTAIVDLSHRAVLSVTGEDRLTWLDSITSQSLRGLAPGDSAETLFLDQNGRLEHAVGVLERRRHHVAPARRRRRGVAARVPAADALHAPGRARRSHG